MRGGTAAGGSKTAGYRGGRACPAPAGVVGPRVDAVEAVRCGRRLGIAGIEQSKVFAAGGLDQPVERVVNVVVARFDAPVSKVDRLLRLIPDVGDVPGRIVGVVQVLQVA